MRQFAIDKGTPKYYALVKHDNMNGLQERLAGRDATIWAYEILMEHRRQSRQENWRGRL